MDQIINTYLNSISTKPFRYDESPRCLVFPIYGTSTSHRPGGVALQQPTTKLGKLRIPSPPSFLKQASCHLCPLISNRKA